MQFYLQMFLSCFWRYSRVIYAFCIQIYFQTLDNLGSLWTLSVSCVVTPGQTHRTGFNIPRCRCRLPNMVQWNCLSGWSCRSLQLHLFQTFHFKWYCQCKDREFARYALLANPVPSSSPVQVGKAFIKIEAALRNFPIWRSNEQNPLHG